LNEQISILIQDLKNSFVRKIENGIIMNYQTAKEIHKWLGKHIEKLEEISNDINISIHLN
jgi:hypothetical protein